MVARPTFANPESELDRLLDTISQLGVQAPLRSTSVTDGSTEFIGEESLVVIGSQLVSGLLQVIGRLTISGLGILTVDGLIELIGNMQVQAGGDITLDGGKVIASNVTIEEDKITIGGASPIVIETAGGQARISVGGATITAFGSSGVVLELGSYRVIANGVEASLSAPGVKVAARNGEVLVDGPVRFQNMSTITQADSGKQVGDPHLGVDGRFYRVVP